MDKPKMAPMAPKWPQWELMHDDGHTWRLRVHGGWIVVSTYISDNAIGVFIPDEQHRWKREEENHNG